MDEYEKNGKAFSRFLKLSAVLCLITLFLCCNYNNGEIYIPTSTVTDTKNDSDVSSVDADGYLNGKWNIWEFIGDFFSGMLK